MAKKLSGLLSSRDRDQQQIIIAWFLQRELDASRAEVTLMHQHGHQQTELLIQQQSQSATAASTRERRRDTLKLEVCKYRGVEEDSLLKFTSKWTMPLRLATSTICKDVPDLGP